MGHLAEFVNEISDVLCGYREAPEPAILGRARKLADLEQTGLIGQSAAKIREAAQALVDVIDNASYDDIEAQQRIAKLEAKRDDYRERWEQTGCTRHHAMETAIKLAESYRQQLDDMAAERDRLLEALSRTIHDCESVPYKDGAHRCDFRIKIDAILQRSRAALENPDAN